MRSSDRIYGLTEIFSDRTQKNYDREAKACDFLLGGIGTGNISVGARGELRSWQIFNQPAVENINPYTFFAIRTQEADGKVTTKVLESEYTPPFAKPQGFLRCETAGWPRCSGSTLSSEYPFVQVAFQDCDLPIKVTMEDAMKADQIFTILMGDQIEPRREFIQANAKFVKNLDV